MAKPELADLDAVIHAQHAKSALHIAVERDKSSLVQRFVVAKANPELLDEFKAQIWCACASDSVGCPCENEF